MFCSLKLGLRLYRSFLVSLFQIVAFSISWLYEFIFELGLLLVLDVGSGLVFRNSPATRPNLGEVVTTCERSWVQASPWGFLSGAKRSGVYPLRRRSKKEWGLSPKEKVRVLHTAQLNVTFRWPPRVTLGRLLPHARGLGFKPRRGGFPSGAKKEWGLSPQAKVRVLHTAQLDVTLSSNH
nr:hypothetical protein [Tanacetum cinerariifolium]